MLTYVIHILSTNTSLHGGTHHILTVPKLLWIILVRDLFAVKILHQNICEVQRWKYLKSYTKLLHFWSNISNNLCEKFSVGKYLLHCPLRATVQSTSWNGFWEMCPFPHHCNAKQYITAARSLFRREHWTMFGLTHVKIGICLLEIWSLFETKSSWVSVLSLWVYRH